MVLTACVNGFGKRTPVEDYRLIRRGGKGVINIKTTDRNGDVVGMKAVCDDDELMLITQKGILIRTRVTEIRETGRNAQGVRLIKLDDGDRLVAMAKIDSDTLVRTAVMRWPFDVAAEASNGTRISGSELEKALEPFAKIRAAVGNRMEIMVELHGLWTLPPALRIASNPPVPSCPYPVNSTPTTSGPYARAADSKSTSIDGRL